MEIIKKILESLCNKPTEQDLAQLGTLIEEVKKLAENISTRLGSDNPEEKALAEQEYKAVRAMINQFTLDNVKKNGLLYTEND